MAFGIFATQAVPAYWAGSAYESGNKPNLSVTYTSAGGGGVASPRIKPFPWIVDTGNMMDLTGGIRQ